IGYEPLKPELGRPILGRETLYYPNLFKYVNHIAKRDGFLSLYKGFFPRLMGDSLGYIVNQKVAKSVCFE
ncbi:hypothetical protein QYM36_018371, partial [Artemia franciscana]